MTLLQSLKPFKAAMIWAALLFSIFLTPSLAQEETEDTTPRQPLFSCGTDTDDGKGFLYLGGIERDFAEWDDLRFDLAENGSGDLVYSFPPDGVDYKMAFLFSHSNGDDGYLVSIRWKDGDTNYVYYSLDIPPDPEVENDIGGGEAGLAISRHGKLIDRIKCTERPYMFISYMREHMSCDTENPYGIAACEDRSAERIGPLDVSTIGLVE